MNTHWIRKSSYLRWLVVTSSLATLAIFGRSSCVTRANPIPGPADLTVITYNVNFGLAGDPATVDALTGQDADVIVLQETNPAWEQAVRAKMDERFPYQYWVHPEHYPAGGNAILSRFPLSKLSRSPSAVGWFEAISAVIDTPAGPVQVIGVHLKPPVSSSGSVVVGYFSTPSERRKEMEAHLKRLHDSELPAILAGDFNEQSGGGLAVARANGFQDAVHRFAPHEPTWRWDVGSIMTLEKQLDHVLHNAALESLSASILNLGRSDHLPIVVRFRFAKPRGHEQ